MKKFLIGFLAAILACTLAVGALAATGKLSIEVNTDMKIRVNGEVFAPTDANGNPVMVFEYNGTTYAPLRALAEAYGLEVGYDAASRMATVDEAVPSVEPNVEPSAEASEPFEWSNDEEEAYEQFKSLWEYKRRAESLDPNSNYWALLFFYKGDLGYSEARDLLNALDNNRQIAFFKRFSTEIIDSIGEKTFGIHYEHEDGSHIFVAVRVNNGTITEVESYLAS